MNSIPVLERVSFEQSKVTEELLSSLSNTNEHTITELFQPIAVRDWMKACPIIQADQLCEDQVAFFRQKKNLSCVVVCNELHHPIGLVMRDRFFQVVGSLYGMSLYRNKTMAELMDVQPLIVELSIEPQELIDRALSRDELTFYDAVLLTDHGRFVGILTVNDLLDLSRLLQREANTRQMRTIRDTEKMINNIHESVAKVTKTSTDTLACSDRITEVTNKGRKELEGIFHLFKLWSDNAKRQEQAIAQLMERTSAVDGIIRLIAELADQCNLLAVNATIEAARAGDHGRGFGVVANEIRTLADQTKQSANQITGIIKSMTEAVKGAAALVGEGKNGSDKGFAQVKQTEDTFAQLWSSSELNQEAAARLIAASSEAKEISNEIRKEVQKLANQLIS